MCDADGHHDRPAHTQTVLCIHTHSTLSNWAASYTLDAFAQPDSANRLASNTMRRHISIVFKKKQIKPGIPVALAGKPPPLIRLALLVIHLHTLQIHFKGRVSPGSVNRETKKGQLGIQNWRLVRISDDLPLPVILLGISFRNLMGSSAGSNENSR